MRLIAGAASLLLVAVLGVAIMMLLPTVFAAGPTGGPSLEQAVDLQGTMSGTLAPGAETWYKVWDKGSNKGIGVVMRYEPAPQKADNLASFNVWMAQRKGWEWENVNVGTATNSSVVNYGLPPGIKYWRGGADLEHTYFLQVFNYYPDVTINYSLAFVGETFPPPTPVLIDQPGNLPPGSPPAVSPNGGQPPAIPVLPVTPPGPTVSGWPPAPSVYVGTTYAVSDTRQIGAYTIRMWRNTSANRFPADNIVTVNAPNQPQLQIETVAGLHELTGKDITGSGYPSLIVETYSGGAHCCFNTQVYELGPRLNKVLDTKPNNCGVRFQDLEGKGIYTATTCDDVFAYKYCPFAYSPAVRVVMRYVPGLGYKPDSPAFAGQFEPDILSHLKTLAEGQPGSNAEWDGTNKCSVLPVVLDYLYSGEPEQARLTVEQFYSGPDLDDWWAEIQDIVTNSMLFVP
jgi:hypothetical protein